VQQPHESGDKETPAGAVYTRAMFAGCSRAMGAGLADRAYRKHPRSQRNVEMRVYSWGRRHIRSHGRTNVGTNTVEEARVRGSKWTSFALQKHKTCPLALRKWFLSSQKTIWFCKVVKNKR